MARPRHDPKRDPDREKVRPPVINVGGLPAADAGTWRADSDHDAVDFAGLVMDEYTAADVRLVECRLSGARFGELVLRRSRLIGSEIADLEATTVDVAESEWTDVVMRGGRVGALLAPGATLIRVALRGVRANYLNLRGASIVDLSLEDCRIEELDLGTATVERARLEGQVARVVLTAATCRSVDLRAADVGEIEGIAELRGTTITGYQLTRLAPAFATHLGVQVLDGGS